MVPNSINSTSISSPISTANEAEDNSFLATHITKRASEVAINGMIKCKLTDEFGLFIQGLLALVAFSTLLLKRCREPSSERRTFRIWFYDTSKQGVGAVVIHFANVLLAGLFSGDPCTWYFINFLLDSTVGLVIIYILLTLTQVVVKLYHLESLRFGEYGTPPKCNAWVGQCIMYLIVVIFEKITIALLVQLEFWEEVRKFILKPMRGHPKVEVAVVMLIVPFLFNAFMFWVVDNILMRKKRKSYQATESKNVKVKYQRRSELPKSPSHSDEEAVLLDNMIDDEEDAIHRRDVVR